MSPARKCWAGDSSLFKESLGFFYHIHSLALRAIQIIVVIVLLAFLSLPLWRSAYHGCRALSAGLTFVSDFLATLPIWGAICFTPIILRGRAKRIFKRPRPNTNCGSLGTNAEREPAWAVP